MRTELVIDFAGEAGRVVGDSVSEVLVDLREKNDRIPPPVDVRFCICSGIGLSDRGTIFQPAGAMSDWESPLALTEASHEVEPLEAMYIAMGPFRVRRACLVNFRVSRCRFDAKVWENGTGSGRVSSSGTILEAHDLLRETR